MPDYLTTVGVVFLGMVALVCGMGAISDIRNGSSRQAHEEVGAARERLPLNYWMGVGQKVFAAIAAFGIAAALIAFS